MIRTKPKKTSKQKEAKAEKFIKGAGRTKTSPPAVEKNGTGSLSKPIMVKIPDPFLAEIDAMAGDLRLTRTAFMMTAVRKQMETLSDPATREDFTNLAIKTWVM